MGLMTQKDMAQQGSERINAFLDNSKENAIQKEFDEDAMQMSDRQAEYESNLWKTDPSKQEAGLISPIDSVLEFTGVSSLGSAFDSASSALEGDYLGAGIEGLAAMVGAVPIVGSKLKKPLKDALGSSKIAVERGDIGVSEALMGGTFLKQYGKDVISRMDTLAVNASVKNGSGKMFQPVADGTRVGVRLNLNSVVPDAPKGLDKLQTIHKKSFSGEVLSYQPYATVTDVTFKVSPAKRRNIAAKIKGVKVKEVEHKNPAMSVNGLLAQTENVVIKGGKDVTEIGFNPMNNHLFIDMLTGQAVKSADVATVIGDRVYAKGVKYWEKKYAPKVMDASDGTPLPSEVRYKFNKGGLVDAEMATLNFSHGGSVHGKVGASNVGADMLAKLIAQNKKGDFKSRDAREASREVMQAPKSTPTTVDDRPALDAAVIKMVQDHKRTQVERAEEFSTPQGLTDKLSNLAEEGGNVLSSMGGSLVAMGGEGYEKAADMGESFMDAGGEIYGEFKDTARLIRNEVRTAYRDYNNGPVVAAQMAAALTPTEPTITSGSTYDDETSGVMPEGSLLYPRVLESNKALYSKLWGKAYHTDAENDVTKQNKYIADVKKHVKPYSRYVKIVAPILNKVIPAFEGDSNVRGDRLYRAMLEIGAHESGGATDLFNEKSKASGVFQTLVSTVRDGAKSDYYGKKARALTGYTPAKIASMSNEEIQTWMQTDFTSNAVFGTLELIKLSKNLAAVEKLPEYLSQLTGPEKMNASSNVKDKTNWKKMIP